MKNKSKIKSIILAIGIIFVLLTINNYNIFDNQGENEGTIENQNEHYLKKPKLSGAYTEPFIHIDDNWTATLAEPWCNLVNGKYVIENVTIDASSSPTGSGIFINNSKTNYFIIRNCMIFNAKSGLYDAGIRLENTNNGTIINNNCSNNLQHGIYIFNGCNNNIISGNTANDNVALGIFLYNQCHNNTISGNTANGNNYGIHLNNCDDNTISGNTANDNDEFGIYILNNCDNNTISINIVSNNITTNQNMGIYLAVGCDNSIISGNSANGNIGHGIWLNNQCDNNSISGNTANDNDEFGIYILNNCDNNTISGNTANNNDEYGIHLNNCDDNTISGNIANNNTIIGIYISSYCNNNTISGNTANDNILHGIVLYNTCNNNTISGNTANGNMQYGIFLFTDCNNNIISGNTANYNDDYGIHLTSGSNNNTISGNIANYNDDYGIFLKINCNNNTISENIIYENNIGISLTAACEDNLIYYNCLSDNSMNNSVDDGTNYWDNGIFGNYWSNYSGIDANLDGIGDSPHDIPGTGSRKDNKPLMYYNPFFSKTPEDMTYEIGTNGHSLLWTVIDISPALLSYNIFRDDIFQPITTGMLLTILANVEILVDGLAEGAYRFTIEVEDLSGRISTDGVWVTVTNTAPEFTVKPNDLSYEVGSTGNNISWVFSDISTDNPSYTITRNSLPLIVDNPCLQGEIIEFSTDGHNTGSYCFTIEIDDGYGETILDSVWVTVNNTDPVFTTTPDDFSYEVGSTGNSISWVFSDISTDNPSYTITRNSLLLIIEQACISGEIIEISVDGLTIGSYCYAIEINDGYDGIVQDSAWVTVINTVPVFTLKPNDTSYEVGSTGNKISWTFSDLSTNNPTYTITRNSLPLIIDAPCISGEAINISADGLEAGSYCFEIKINDGYDEIIKDATWVTVKSSMGLNLLYVEIFEQSFSEKEFNITFSVYNESSQGIDSATIQMWWNGTDVSNNIVDLGNGLYFVSLEPITVAPGDDPILLNMVISASGYEDKPFDTYLAVDPETLEKKGEKDGEEFPFLIIVIAIVSAAGGIGATIITLGILRKRKGISMVT